MKKILIKKITDFVITYQDNADIFTEWGHPIVGFASAFDSLFFRLRDVVSPTHAVPQDFLPAAKTVIAYFLPFKKILARRNIKGKYSSEDWCVAYIETNEMIRKLGLYLREWLISKGHQSCTIPATHNWDEKKLISDWSHRHVAYIAGLGSFGLNNMLITEKGCCGRIGSFITEAEIEPDTITRQEACLYKYDGSCKKCVQKCVNEALHVQSFDRFKCYEMLLKNEEKHRSIGYADVCGKCLAGVPCAHMNPVQKRRQSKERISEESS